MRFNGQNAVRFRDGRVLAPGAGLAEPYRSLAV